MITRENKDRVSGAVFLIGLGVLFTPLGKLIGGFFPGILFVIGATAIAHSMAEGEGRDQMMGGLFMLGLGTFFLLGFNLPLLLIGLGIFVLLGYHQKLDGMHERHLNQHPRKHFHREQEYIREPHDMEFTSEKRKHDEYV